VLLAAALLGVARAESAPSTVPARTADSVMHAQELLDRGEFAEAEAELRRMGSAAPTRILATSVARQGRYQEAAKLLAAELAESGKTPDPREGDSWWIIAARWAAPPEALSHHARGLWHVKVGQFAEGKAEFEAALKMAPGLADAHYHLGYALEELGDEAAAEREYRAAIAGYAPSERVLKGSAEYNLGNLLWRAHPPRAQEAVRLLRSALAPEAQGRQPGILIALGSALGATGDEAGSRAALAEAVEAAGRGAYLPSKIADQVRSDLFGQGCRPRPAGAAPGQPPRCAPAAAVNRFRVAQEAGREGRFEASAAACREALALDPDYGAALFSLGQALVRLERWKEAEAPLRKALASTELAGSEFFASNKMALALALVNADAKDPGAVLLAEEASAISREPAQRAWFDLLVGRAFAQVGNRACALWRLERAAAADGTPEQGRLRAEELIAEVKRTLPAEKARPDCFEYELYRPTSLAGEAKRYRKEHPYEAPNPPSRESSEFHPFEKYRVRVRVTGAIRPVPSAVALFFERTAKARAKDGGIVARMAEMFRREVEVEEVGARWWLPIQETLAPSLQEELPQGGEADLYVLLMGAVNKDVVLVVNEFRARAP